MKIVTVNASNGKTYTDCRKSKYASNYSPVIISDYMSGKMDGIPSISTSVIDNPICQARQKVKGSICEHCFAQATLDRYSSAHLNAKHNLDLLTSELLPVEVLPKFRNVAIVRIESFGDLANGLQAANYLNIIMANPRVKFAWWTKNYNLFVEGMKILGLTEKPENMTLVYSSMFINEQTNREDYPLADYVFTVYDDQGIKDHNVTINCGARDCVGCQRCYHKGNSVNVYEKLK